MLAAFHLPDAASEKELRSELLTLRCVQRRHGEKFDRRWHSSGTEVKAITYSAMQVTSQTKQGDAEIFVIVDI